MDYKVFIPSNEYGIAENYYKMNDIVTFLRENKNNPEVIQFIADMLEEQSEKAVDHGCFLRGKE